jgi:hypothetical protein
MTEPEAKRDPFQPVMKRHPRLAVWRWRALVAGPAVVLLGLAAMYALEGDWLSAAMWFCVVLIIRAYEQRLRRTWWWGWRAGHDTAFRDLLPLVRLDEGADVITRLHPVFMAEPPRYQEELERLSQIDHEATMKASVEYLEGMLGDMNRDA